ncbi:MAG TPA: ABC transporter permease, partial [Candidatus Eisenbacteria bacterium]|nr:ABC transporter permease [Candidatus Eisenbacteria bacterium]
MPFRDLAFAGRTLRKSPVFALTAALTIALGVGASTAIFSVTNAVLLRPLPYQKPDQLVIIPSDMRNRGVKDFPFSNANFIDLREATKGEFQGLAGVFTFPITLTGEDGVPEKAHLGVVTMNYFQLVGARIVLGRDFIDDDGRPQPPPPATGTQATPTPRLPVMAIISYEYFQRRFGSNPAAIGQSLNKGKPFSPQIVGVLEPHFQIYFPPSADLEAAPDIWIANRLGYDAAQRNGVSMRVIARLRPGITIGRAQAAVDQVAADARKNFTIENTAGYAIRVEPMRQHLVSEVRPAILALMGAVIFLLLIACANVANLLLVRASLRQHELAIRSAIGAGWWDLARQILSEALLLAAMGAIGGLAIAWLGIHELLAIAPAYLPRLDSIRIDSTVLIFTIISSLAAAAIFGLAPAWRAASPDVMIVLRGSSRNEGLASGGLSRKIVVGVEVALAYVLLIGSGLMVRSFLELQRIDPGFDPKGLLTFQVQSDRFLPTPQERAVAIRQLEDRLRAIPGVQSVTAASPFPLTGGFSPIRWGTEEALADASKYKAVDPLIVLPGYFETMHTALIEGRTFNEDDNQPGRTDVVVDKILADRAYPNQSAVGKRILIRIQTPEPVWVNIIGVVAHERGVSLSEPGREQVFLTDAYVGSGATDQWALRTGTEPAKYANNVLAAIKAFDPHLLVTDMKPMEAVIDKAQSGTRFSLLLIGTFAVIAALLAGVGLYGVLATVVRQRTAEIGIRMALGAQPANIFQLVVGQGLRLTAIGVVVGLFAAFALTREMVSMLVGIKATDPLTFVTMAVLFFLIAAISSWLPAQRAARLDPTAAL